MGKWIELSLIIYLIFNILIECYMMLYTRFKRERDKKKILNKSIISNEQMQNNKQNNIKQNVYSTYRMFEQFSYGLMRYRLILIGRIPSYRIRYLFYRYIYCMDITPRTKIAGGCEFRSPWNIHADNCTIGVGCILDARAGIVLGQNVVLGGGVHIWTEEHSTDDPYFRVLNHNAKQVVIKERAWICSDSTILPGCIINEGVVVASRSCVTKDCEAFGVYAGIPAKKIKQRNNQLEYELNKRPGWWFY